MRLWREPTILHGRISKIAASYFTEMMGWRSRARARFIYMHTCIHTYKYIYWFEEVLGIFWWLR